MTSSGEDFDPGLDTRNAGKRPVALYGGGAEHLGECQIERIVHRGVVTQLERPRQQSRVRMPRHPEPRQVVQCRERQ